MSDSAFYKGESQEKKFPNDWKERKCSRCFPAHFMLRGSGDFRSLEIHSVFVTAFSDLKQDKLRGCNVSTMLLSEAQGL